MFQYEKPDMKVYEKKHFEFCKIVIKDMKDQQICSTVVCKGRGGISVDLENVISRGSSE